MPFFTGILQLFRGNMQQFADIFGHQHEIDVSAGANMYQKKVDVNELSPPFYQPVEFLAGNRYVLIGFHSRTFLKSAFVLNVFCELFRSLSAGIAFQRVDIPFDFGVTIHPFGPEQKTGQFLFFAQPPYLPFAQMEHPAGVVKIENGIAVDHVVLLFTASRSLCISSSFCRISVVVDNSFKVSFSSIRCKFWITVQKSQMPEK